MSFPIDLARQAEKLAKAESRTMSELFREAFRTYRAEQARKRLEAGHAYARSRTSGAQPGDVERFVKDDRRQRALEKDCA